MIAKWLLNDPRILLLNDPTRGIDVGTKQEIYRLLRALADDGAAILFYSTDYEELIGCCNRVLVMYGGRIVSEFAGDDLNEHRLLASALNRLGDRRGAKGGVVTADRAWTIGVFAYQRNRGAFSPRCCSSSCSPSTCRTIRPASPGTWCRPPPTRRCCWPSSRRRRRWW